MDPLRSAQPFSDFPSKDHQGLSKYRYTSHLQVRVPIHNAGSIPKKGAICVYAIEGVKPLFDKLCQNVKTVLKDPAFAVVKPWHIWLQDAETIAGMVYQTHVIS